MRYLHVLVLLVHATALLATDPDNSESNLPYEPDGSGYSDNSEWEKEVNYTSLRSADDAERSHVRTMSMRAGLIL
jgi:hypothetical protein